MKLLDRMLQRWRFAKAAPLVPQNAIVLDVGCGDGALLKTLEPQLEAGYGIDPSLNVPAGAGKIQFIRGSFPEQLPEIPSCDCILMLAYLEHVRPGEQMAVARRCWELLKPGGRVVLTVPSPAVDPILTMLKAARVIDGIALDEHYGFSPAQTLPLFTGAGFRLLSHQRFQLGLNHLFLFQKPACRDVSHG